MKRSLVERITSRIEMGEGCWIWPGAQTSNGYGIITQYQPGGKYKGYTTHRVLYEALVGPVPEGLDLDHLCRVRNCCNPSHLEPVTRRENSHRGAKYRPSQCPHGHEYTEENSVFTKAGHIKCRACERENQRKQREKRRAAIYAG